MGDITALMSTDSLLLKYMLILALATWTLKQVVQFVESSEKVSYFLVKAFKTIIRSKTRNYNISDKSLKEKTSELVGELNSFVADQNMAAPELVLNNFETTARTNDNHNRKITGLYQQRFAQRVGFLYQEYKKRGCESETIEDRYLKPYTVYDIYNIINEFIKLSSEIK
ncbi:hypothetical protein [Vreelandella venusta]|uniref:hypothetical protein n=1 Tax=Vreelandella venusta TaxID=44935 RepID=UPI00200C6E2D|nr:hypothetical protein [Halomonas venusta]UQI38795.1 hypothetical protein M3L73_11150 [Halomonas venusta]